MSAIEFCIETVRLACEMPEPAAEAAAELAQLRAAVGRLERIEAAAREIAEMRNDDTYKMYNVPARMVDALAAALAADERGTG
jgi:hypothetical protein